MPGDRKANMKGLQGQIGKSLSAVGPRGAIARFVYFGGIFLGLVLAWMYSRDIGETIYRVLTRNSDEGVTLANWLGPRIAFTALGGIAGGFIASVVSRWTRRLAQKWDGLDQSDKVTTFVGIFLGLVVASPLVTFFSQITNNRVTLALLIVGIGVGAAAIAVYALQSMAEILPWYRARGVGKRTGIKILDTNVIIDGRIYDVARSGFLEGQLYVPKFVLEELQYIADSHDPLRRQRGKRGLEVLRHLQGDFPLEVGLHDRHAPEGNDGVDARLVRLARAVGGDLVTNDHNLNRVATLQDVRVLNLNDLALSLRPNVLPQEKLILSIIREGNQLGQGVGYLDDGTMVVVENGKNHVGETLDVLVTQVIQTERGKLIFAEVEGEPSEPTRRRSGPRRSV